MGPQKVKIRAPTILFSTNFLEFQTFSPIQLQAKQKTWPTSSPSASPNSLSKQNYSFLNYNTSSLARIQNLKYPIKHKQKAFNPHSLKKGNPHRLNNLKERTNEQSSCFTPLPQFFTFLVHASQAPTPIISHSPVHTSA